MSPHQSFMRATCTGLVTAVGTFAASRRTRVKPFTSSDWSHDLVASGRHPYWPRASYSLSHSTTGHTLRRPARRSNCWHTMFLPTMTAVRMPRRPWTTARSSCELTDSSTALASNSGQQITYSAACGVRECRRVSFSQLPIRVLSTNSRSVPLKCFLRISSMLKVMNLLAWQPNPVRGSFGPPSPMSHRLPPRP